MSEPLDPRIETSHLSVESIIRTYANRLIEQESRSMTAEIIEERDILLAWWAEREAAALAAQERVASLEGALDRIEGLREHAQRQGTWGIEYGDDQFASDVLSILLAALSATETPEVVG